MGLWSLIKYPFTTTIRLVSISVALIQFAVVLSWTLTRAIPVLIYVFSVIFSSLALFAAYDENLALQVQQTLPFLQFGLTAVVTLVTEVPHLLLALRVVGILAAKLFGILNSWFAYLFLILDVVGIAGYIYFLDLNYRGVSHITTQFKCSTDAKYSFLKMFGRSLTPRYSPDVKSSVVIYSDIQYQSTEVRASFDASDANIRDYGLCDIYSVDYDSEAFDSSRPRPVMIHAHGGKWVRGNKGFPNPIARILAERGFVVVSLNYRLARSNPLPAAVDDIKDAIKWCKKNIGKFGGDSEFIMLSGESAGGHLALTTVLLSSKSSSAAAAEGEGEGEEEAAVKAVILMSPVIDVLDAVPDSKLKQKDFFVGTVCRNDQELAKSFAPLTLLSQGAKVPPTRIFHGTSDTMVSVQGSREFARAAREGGFNVDLVALDHTHHLFSLTNSMKTIASAEAIADWAKQLYQSRKKLQ